MGELYSWRRHGAACSPGRRGRGRAVAFPDLASMLPAHKTQPECASACDHCSSRIASGGHPGAIPALCCSALGVGHLLGEYTQI
jgi:hypothetical protein